MLLRVGIVFVFLVSAHAQPPRSPVFAAIAPSLEAPARPLAELIKALDAPGRARAVDALDALNRDTLAPPALMELSEAYRLLGRPEKALLVARALPARDVTSPAGDAQSIQALAQAGNYAEAQATAENALKRFPRNENLLALFHSVKGRVTSSGQEKLSAKNSTGNSSTASSADNRPFVLSSTKKRSAPLPAGLDSFQISSEDTNAPVPTFWDRIVAFVTPDDRLIESDVGMLREKSQGFNLLEGVVSMTETDPEAPRQFAEWLKKVKPEDLPPIEYGIVGPGDYAQYQKGAFGRGRIVMSHYIRDLEPEARATVLMHEVFHYWDFNVARLYHPGSSYGGYIAPENQAETEYNSYLLTAHFWQYIRPKETKSSMARELDRLPTDPEEIRRKVDAMIERKRSRKG